MSFGFSVGDFLAVGSLINDIVCSLREAGGSKSEHQELVRELESLQQALSHLDKLQLGKSSQTSLESIKYAAYSCRRPLEQFLGKIKKYEKSLGVWSQRSSLKSATDKLRWAFGEKDEIRKLQSYLNVHVGTINILLAEHGLETMDIDSKKAEADQLHVRARLDDTRKVIDWIKSSVSAQALAIQTTQSMLSKLCELVSGESITSWKSFGEMVAKMCVSTQQIYTVVLEIKDSLSLGNTSWTYFQAPLIVEDALGFKFPVPSEYDFELLDTIIKHRFLEGPGSSEVEAGNYELFNTKNSRQVISANARLLPGANITMAILVSRAELVGEECPMLRCRSTRTTAAPGGGRLCCACNVWFDKSSKRWNALQDVVGQQFQTSTTGKRKLGQDEAPRKRIKVPNTENDSDVFKSVKWWQQEAAVQSISESSTSNEPILSDELAYLDNVKAAFPNDTDTYNRYLDIMADFKAGSTQTSGAIERIKELFAGKEDLIQGFNRFLPPGYRMSTGSRGPIEYHTAMAYVNKVKNICAENPHIYKNFLETLQRYQQEFLPIQDTYAIITRLFEDYPHLVEEFKTFLPESAAAARRNRLRRGKASLRRVEMRRKSMRRTYLPQY